MCFEISWDRIGGCLVYGYSCLENPYALSSCGCNQGTTCTGKRERRSIAPRTMLISEEHASRPGVIHAMALQLILTVADGCASLLEGSEGKRLLVQRGL